MFWRRQRSEPASPSEIAADPLRVVAAYHEASKHDWQRYAAGPPELDWDTQPDPFRRFAGAQLVPLELREPDDGRPFYEEAFCAGRVAAAPLSHATLSQFLFDSLALSGAKRYGDARWTLRCNPSSGNLHPTEAYVLAPELACDAHGAFLAHYAPHEHALEVRARLESSAWERLAAGLGSDTFLVALASIHWREAWKYGERAFRYCQHDVGHAIGALAVAAAALGWRARVLDELGSDELARLLGTDLQSGPEAEAPEVLVAIRTQQRGVLPRAPAPDLLASLSLRHSGVPNCLSSGHVDWPAIDAVEAATRKPRTVAPEVQPALAPAWSAGDEPIALRRVVRGRRSAVAFDGRTGMARDAFEQLLRRTLPREGEIVLASWSAAPRVDLLCFVHRVEGLDPGLYLCLRDPQREARWRASARVVCDAERVDAAGLTLLRLKAGDARALSRSLACHQEIAADGCVAFGMLADFEAALAADGPWAYRRLFWECGLVGQLLYLEAEALGLRATGIGCFFDDPVHRALGLVDHTFQSLYHFTLGAAVDDPRIESTPAYAHLDVRA
ncbi:MAG: SagB/ThcOx family dehydrogenase [Planctomycetes bacterium]|nr:SagB/ThcOx family dehydrogenase [Planctomycetota bacterium]